MNKPVEVVCAIICREGEVLITQRTQKQVRALRWEFPGGKINPGETYSKAITREIEEELGKKVTPVRALTPVYYNYPDIRIKLIPIICNITGSQLNSELPVTIKWINLESISEIDLCEADLLILPDLKQLTIFKTGNPI